MNEVIRQRARELGFDDCRITTADPPVSAPQFAQWLADGNQGEMNYLERNAHQRMDPQKVLPEAKSIITLVVSYATEAGSAKATPAVAIKKIDVAGPVEFPSRDDASLPRSAGTTRKPQIGAAIPGVVARYARYEDYHDVLGGKLRELANFVNQLGGPQTRSLWYVDTGPLLERDLAQRAGLGFVGKHTNLISRKLGNWIFLAEIITTLELMPEESERNRCGSCTRCISACPTGAIRAPFQLDARLCISYLTIELKGPIPRELRAAIGNRIFGCDDCLAACPWNRFAHQGALMKAAARPELGEPDLLGLLALDEAGFKRTFAHTPIWRAKRRGLLRNVCVALGNRGDPAALPALRKAERDLEPLIAEHAHWAIERIHESTSPAKEDREKATGSL